MSPANDTCHAAIKNGSVGTPAPAVAEPGTPSHPVAPPRIRLAVLKTIRQAVGVFCRKPSLFIVPAMIVASFYLFRKDSYPNNGIESLTFLLQEIVYGIFQAITAPAVVDIMHDRPVRPLWGYVKRLLSLRFGSSMVLSIVQGCASITVVIFAMFAIWARAFAAIPAVMVLLVALHAFLVTVIPVSVLENSGFLSSLRRSWNLTKGSSFPVAAILVVWFFGSYAITLCTAGAVLAMSGAGIGRHGPMIALVTAGVVRLAITAIIPVVIYCELRRINDGDTADGMFPAGQGSPAR